MVFLGCFVVLLCRFCLILFIPFEHELKRVGASEYHGSWWGRSRQGRAFRWGSDIVDFSQGSYQVYSQQRGKG